MKSSVALARVLDVLFREGHLSVGSIGARTYASLVSLFDAGVLEKERRGSGFRVVVLDRAALGVAIRKLFPSGLADVLTNGSNPVSRVQSVSLFRDAKVARRANVEPVLMRGFGDAVLRKGDVGGFDLGGRADKGDLDLAAWTRTAGVAALDLGQECLFQFHGIVAIVENIEAFMLVENVIPDLDSAIYSAGRMSGRLLDWLAGDRMADCQFIHFGDYDPVGIDEYLKLLGKCPGRVSLYLPEGMEEYFEKFAKKELLEKSEAILRRLRGCEDAQARLVVGLMDRFGGGVEQEIIFEANTPKT